DASFLNHDRTRVDVAGDHRARLQLDPRGRADVALNGSANDHLARGDVADHGCAVANDDDIGATDRAVESAVDAQCALGLDVTTNVELRVQHRVTGAGRRKIGRIRSAFKDAHRMSRAVKGEAMKLADDNDSDTGFGVRRRERPAWRSV